MKKLIPYEFQQEAIDSISDFFRTAKGNPLIVAPTGSGKSVIIACFCQQTIEKWSSQKILILSHVQTILQQNYHAVQKQCYDICPVGLYSSGLKSKKRLQITIAGIQSIYKKPELFDTFDIILIDECHSIPINTKGRYNLFLDALQKPIVGFTATPYRFGTGYLHETENSMFAGIAYEIEIKKLQEQGLLCNLVSKATHQRMSVEGIKKTAGDFNLNQLSLKFDRQEITKRIVQELTKYQAYRKKWLVFGIDIKHVEHITEELKKQGITCASIHSKKAQCMGIIDDFKNNKYQALVSVAMLTTGFDVPQVDLIVLMRPTSSTVLHVQIIGRGLRIAPDKKDCLVLDFAGNIKRNGSIDNPNLYIKGKGGGDPIIKECDKCFELVHSAVKICPACQYVFPFQHHLQQQPDVVDIIDADNWLTVSHVSYHYHKTKSGKPSLLVKYLANLSVHREYINLEHGGYARYKAEKWWEKRYKGGIIPDTVNEALQLISDLQYPKQILIKKEGQYNVIKDYLF